MKYSSDAILIYCSHPQINNTSCFFLNIKIKLSWHSWSWASNVLSNFPFHFYTHRFRNALQFLTKIFMLWSIYCFCTTRCQCTDEKGIQEEMGNNSVQSVLEQKVKLQNILYECNRIGLEAQCGLAQPCPGSSAQVLKARRSSSSGGHWPQAWSVPTHWNPSGKMGYSNPSPAVPELQREGQIIGSVSFLKKNKICTCKWSITDKSRTDVLTSVYPLGHPPQPHSITQS